jgi:hypothetical protein
MELQRRVLSICHHELVSSIATILERTSPTDDYLLIDSIELDIGTINWDSMESRLCGLVMEKLETITDHLHTESLGQHSYTTRRSDSAGHKANIARYVNFQTAAMEAYFNFLSTGQLPSFFRLPPGENFEDMISKILDEPKNHPAFKAGLAHVLLQQPARERLAIQGTNQFLDKIFHHLGFTDRRVMHDLTNQFANFNSLIFKQKLTEAILEPLASGNKPGSRLNVFGDVLRLMRDDTRNKGATFVKQLEAGLDELPHELKIILKTILDEPKARRARKNPVSSEQGANVVNAGVILLHPFLEQLFTARGIVENGALIEPERALLLLHYLATGSGEAEEYELTFSKLLCGIPIESPVALHEKLQLEDVEEADALLRAVIQHWSALHHTSPEALRGTFLVRPAKVSVAHNGEWLLRVERESFDILLDNLPWGISIVKLPWMPQLIRVEWR